MKTETTLNIYQKLLRIQQAVNGLGKDKSTYNYKYVTGDKVLEHIKPIMNELGLLLKQEIISIDNVRQDYATKSGNKSEILSKLMMRFTWVDTETGDKDENLFGANGQNDWDKGVGSALTYAERYFLLKYFHIATDEDDIDNPDSKNDKPLITNEQLLRNAKDVAELGAIFKALPKEKQLELKELTSKLKVELSKAA